MTLVLGRRRRLLPVLGVTMLLGGCGSGPTPVPRPVQPQAGASTADINAVRAKEPALCGATTPAATAVTLPRMTVSARPAKDRLTVPSTTRTATAATVRTSLARSGQDGVERAGAYLVALVEDPPIRYRTLATARSELALGLTAQGEHVLLERTRLALDAGWPRRWDAATTRYTATLNSKRNVGVFTQVGLLRVTSPGKEASTFAPWQVRRALLAWDGKIWRTVCLSTGAPVHDLASDTATSVPASGSRYSVSHTWQRYVGAK